MKTDCNMCGDDFEVNNLTHFCDKCLMEHGNDFVEEGKRQAISTSAQLGEVFADLEAIDESSNRYYYEFRKSKYKKIRSKYLP